MAFKNIPFLSLLFSVFFIVTFFYLTYTHEQVHVEIFRSYNINSKIDMFSYFPDAVTIPEENCPDEYCNLANNLNEAFSYPLFILFALIGFGFFLIILLKEIELMRRYEENIDTKGEGN